MQSGRQTVSFRQPCGFFCCCFFSFMLRMHSTYIFGCVSQFSVVSILNKNENFYRKKKQPAAAARPYGQTVRRIFLRPSSYALPSSFTDERYMAWLLIVYCVVCFYCVYTTHSISVLSKYIPLHGLFTVHTARLHIACENMSLCPFVRLLPISAMRCDAMR